jgi:hypothetical protein
MIKLRICSSLSGGLAIEAPAQTDSSAMLASLSDVSDMAIV